MSISRIINILSKFLQFLPGALLFILCVTSAPVSAADEYKLGPGDVVRITVYENPDMNTDTQVSEAGTVTFPLLGSVNIGGLSRAAAEAKLAKLLQKGGFVNQPQINIAIAEYRSQQVSVLGQVGKPGKYAIDGPSNILDLISLAGGISDTGADYITLVKDEHGKYVKHTVDLSDFLTSGNVKDNIQVGNGDVIYVARAPVFYIYGEVQRAGAYRLEPNMTVMQAISVGGGLSERGTQRGLKVSRRDAQGRSEMVVVGLTDPVQENDVVYVKESLF